MIKILIPPALEDEEKNNKAFCLYILVIALLISITVSTITLSVMLSEAITRWLGLFMTGSVIAFIILKLLQKERIFAASIFSLVSFWLFTTVTAWTAGGIAAPAVMFYFLMVLIAGFLLGFKAGIYMAVISSITELGLVIAKSANYLPKSSIQHTDFTLWITHIFFLASFAVIHYIFTHRVQVALEKAKHELTERKLMETELSKSEERFRTLFDNSPVGISIIIKDKLLQVNKAFAEMFGFLDPAELKGTSMQERISGEDKSEASEFIMRNSNNASNSISLELIGLKKDQSIFPIRLEMTHMNLSEGNAAIAYVSDSTVSVQREESVKASLKEKEILLKEIHHRVKNNMQIITSLLSLKADSIEDNLYRSIFNDSIMRIRSMAIIHEKLYQSDNFAMIDCNDYLNELVRYLHTNYCFDFYVNQVETEIEHIILPIDTAIPLGLIVNELVTNVFKYAFPSGIEGLLSIRLNSAEANLCRLTISDNGIGLPEGFDINRTESLGLTLVTNLCKQLHGTLHVSSNKGTRFIIEFPLEDSTSTKRHSEKTSGGWEDKKI